MHKANMLEPFTELPRIFKKIYIIVAESYINNSSIPEYFGSRTAGAKSEAKCRIVKWCYLIFNFKSL